MRPNVETLHTALERMREEVNHALHALIQSEVELGAGEVALEAGRVLNAVENAYVQFFFFLPTKLLVARSKMMSCRSPLPSN